MASAAARIPRKALGVDDFKPWIDEVLRADLTAPSKQRPTVTRLYDRLVREHDMKAISYDTVRRYVAVRRPEIAREAGSPIDGAFIAQTHQPGQEAEYDSRRQNMVKVTGLPRSIFVLGPWPILRARPNSRR